MDHGRICSRMWSMTRTVMAWHENPCMRTHACMSSAIFTWYVNQYIIYHIVYYIYIFYIITSIYIYTYQIKSIHLSLSLFLSYFLSFVPLFVSLSLSLPPSLPPSLLPRRYRLKRGCWGRVWRSRHGARSTRNIGCQADGTCQRRGWAWNGESLCTTWEKGGTYQSFLAFCVTSWKTST